MLDSSLQSALVDRWRSETLTFHLRCGELTPTLKDMSLITGLPISGKPLVPTAFSSDWPDDIQVRLDTEVPNSGARGGRRPRGVPMSWLTGFYHEILDYATEKTLRRHLFAYLLFLFGMIFPSVHMDVCLPSLIKITKEIVDAPLPTSPLYNFGSALLAHTYRGLCDATRKKGAGSHTLIVPYEFLQL
jgi:hypothetical protein